MELLPSSVLEDERYRVPAVAAGPTGLAWLRGHVARFCDGDAHTRRRALVEAVVADLTLEPGPAADPTAALVAAMGLPPESAGDVALAAGSYQPHLPQSAEADAAVERLVTVCGSRDEATAARICVLVQAHGATAELVGNLRRGSTAPPVPTTRRVGPDGALVEVDLSDAPFGRGRHACPGETVATDLARAATR